MVPFGAAALVLAFTSVSESASPKGRRLDLSGQVLSILALGLLAFGFIQAPALGWSSPLILGCESATPGALLSPAVFRNRAFSVAIANAAMMTFGFYTLLFIFPLYLQEIRGNSAVVTGLKLLPLSITFFLVSLIAGRLLHRVGARALIAAGLGLFGAGLLALTLVSGQSSFAAMVPALVAIGLGNGLAFGAIMTVAVSNVDDSRSGMSSGLVNVARMVGATLGVAIPGSIFGAHVVRAGHDVTKFLVGMHRAFFLAGLDEVAGGLIALSFLGFAAKQALDTRKQREYGRDRDAA